VVAEEAVVVDADVAAAVSSHKQNLPVKNTFHRHLIRMNFLLKRGAFYLLLILILNWLLCRFRRQPG
jgi:hypothetical protein